MKPSKKTPDSTPGTESIIGPESTGSSSISATSETETTTPSSPALDPEPEATPEHEPIEEPTPAGRRAEQDDPLRGSRTSGIYAAIVGLGIVLVLLIIFIAQNTQSGDVHFLWLDGRAPVAVLLLIALVAGIFLTAIAGSLRIIQLRRRVKKVRKTDARP